MRFPGRCQKALKEREAALPASCAFTLVSSTLKGLGSMAIAEKAAFMIQLIFP